MDPAIALLARLDEVLNPVDPSGIHPDDRIVIARHVLRLLGFHDDYTERETFEGLMSRCVADERQRWPYDDEPVLAR